jgi:hypothetical protein
MLVDNMSRAKHFVNKRSRNDWKPYCKDMAFLFFCSKNASHESTDLDLP